MQESRQGFGFAVRRALDEVTTKFVMVCHHDQRYVRSWDLAAVLTAMQRNPGVINYVGVLSPSTLGYRNKCICSKLPDPLPGARGLPDGSVIDIGPEEKLEESYLLPLYRWFDRNHIASKAFYLNNVFQSGLVKKGTFIEDCYGQDQLSRIKDSGLEAHMDFGTFVLIDGDTTAIHHIDGRRWMTAEQRASLNLPPLKGEEVEKMESQSKEIQ